MTQRRTRRVRETMADRKKTDPPPSESKPKGAPKGHPQDVQSALVRFLDALTDLSNTINEAIIREGDK